MKGKADVADDAALADRLTEWQFVFGQRSTRDILQSPLRIVVAASAQGRSFKLEDAFGFEVGVGHLALLVEDGECCDGGVHHLVQIGPTCLKLPLEGLAVRDVQMHARHPYRRSVLCPVRHA